MRPRAGASAWDRREKAKKEHPELSDEDICVCFISPCPAKVSYVKNGFGEYQSAVDEVLSISDIYFSLINVMRRANVPASLSKSGMIGISWATSGGESSAIFNDKYLAADGIENVNRVLDQLENGVIQRVEFIESYKERRDCLDQKWAELVQECNAIPLILPNNLDAVKALLQQVKIDGIILTGGNDLVAYGGTAVERDELEEYLIEYAMKLDCPLLGVCRGMQMIQNYFNVPLYRINGHVAVKHEITMSDQNMMKNSYHGFGTKETSSELLVMAVAEDGVIEAVKYCTMRIYGMMWHPERNNPFDQKDVDFMKQYFNTIF